jgi:hypothetical protein
VRTAGCPYIYVCVVYGGKLEVQFETARTRSSRQRTLVVILRLEAVVAAILAFSLGAALFMESCELRSTTALKESERGAEKLVGRTADGTGLFGIQ